LFGVFTVSDQVRLEEAPAESRAPAKAATPPASPARGADAKKGKGGAGK